MSASCINNTIDHLDRGSPRHNATNHVINPLSEFQPLAIVRVIRRFVHIYRLIMAHDTPHTCTSTDVEGSVDTDDHTLAR